MTDASMPIRRKIAGQNAQSLRVVAWSDNSSEPRRQPAQVVRMDTHVHSNASSGSALAALGLLGVPECYTTPEEAYDQARTRAMDLVTITDHDTIDGALSLVERGFSGLIVGEEVTTHFPEDHCKMHVLVWGLNSKQHEQIHELGLRNDIYDFAHWLKRENLAHSLAHPLYDQNARLSVWHIERCALLFKCFETLNGAHDGRPQKNDRTLLRIAESRQSARTDKQARSRCGLASLLGEGLYRRLGRSREAQHRAHMDGGRAATGRCRCRSIAVSRRAHGSELYGQGRRRVRRPPCASVRRRRSPVCFQAI